MDRKPTWGTCAGLILLAEVADSTKKGGQELIGGLDVRVNRNHFGRQMESFETYLDLPFLAEQEPPARGTMAAAAAAPFRAIFIRAPIIEHPLPHVEGIRHVETEKSASVAAPSRRPRDRIAAKLASDSVTILARLPDRLKRGGEVAGAGDEGGIVAVRQGNVFGTSFHPELPSDARIHDWWLRETIKMASK